VAPRFLQLRSGRRYLGSCADARRQREGLTGEGGDLRGGQGGGGRGDLVCASAGAAQRHTAARARRRRVVSVSA
jgi:hypothetical protein